MASSKEQKDGFGGDIHNKMNKKIAQLTKVIYHLNTRNEDHQSELDVLSYNYQVELQQIARDAASKIAKFKDLVDGRKLVSALEAQIVALKKQFEADKQQAMHDLEMYKEKVEEREKKMTKEYQTKVEKQQKDIGLMNSSFQDKLGLLEGLNQDLRKALETTRSSSSTGIDELKRKHEKDVAELTALNNDRMQQAVAEHAKEKTTMQEEHRLALEQALRDLTERLKGEADKALGQIRAQMGGDKQEALMSVRREMEEKMQQLKQEHEAKIDKLNNELLWKKTECDSLVADKAGLLEELNRRLAEAEAKMGQEVGGAHRELRTLQDFLASAQEENKVLSARVEERDEQIARLERILKEKGATLAASEKAVAEAKVEMKRLQDALGIAERDTTSLRGEINQMALTLAQLREELKTSEKNLTKTTADLNKTIATLTADRDRLQKLLDETKKSMSSMGDKASNEVLALRKLMEEKEAEFVRIKGDMERAQRQSLEDEQKKHAAEIEALKATMAALKETSKQREAQLKQEMDATRMEGETKLKDLTDAHKKATEEMKAKHKQEIDELKQAMKLLESQMSILSSQSDGEKGTMRGEMNKLESRCTSLQQDLEAKRKESERAEGICNGLKTQVENLREELKATQKAYQDKMEMSLAKLEAEWQAKMLKMQQEHAAGVIAAVAKAEAVIQNQLVEARRTHQQEIDRLQAQLDALQLATQAGNAEADEIGRRLKAQLEAEQQAHVHDVDELNAQLAAEKRRLEQEKQNELDGLRGSMEKATADRIAGLEAKHGEDLESVRQAVVEAQAAHAAILASSMSEAADKLAAAVLAERLRCEGLQATALTEAATLHGIALEKQKKSTEETVSALTDTISSMKDNIEALSDVVREGERLLLEEKAERVKQDERKAAEKQRMQRDHEAALQQERSESARQLSDAEAQAALELAELDATFRQEMGKYELRLQEAAKEYKALELRWRNRESRPEDLARIAQLEREMVEKDDLVARTREEMIYFKRELLNREENFNSKFNRQPNVGVMQVIKPREKNDSSSSSSVDPNNGHKAATGIGFGGKANGSSKPMYSVPSSGGSVGGLSVGGNGGMGIGGSSMTSASAGSIGAQGGLNGKGVPGKPGPGANARGLL